MKNLLTLCLALVVSFAFVSNAAAQGDGQTFGAGPGAPVTIPMIVGQIVSVDSQGTEFPLSHESGWVRSVSLRRLDPGTGLYGFWENMTDCWESHQGCADQFGTYRFTETSDRNRLNPGDVEVVVEAWGHEPSRVSFTLGSTGIHRVTHRMKMKPVTLDYIGSNDVLPSDGGALSVTAMTCNLDANTELVQAQVLIGGATKTQEWGSYQIPSAPVVVPPQRWTCHNVTLEASIDRELPNGRYYCANFTLGDAKAPSAETSACVRKVALPLGAPIGNQSPGAPIGNR